MQDSVARVQGKKDYNELFIDRLRMDSFYNTCSIKFAPLPRSIIHVEDVYRPKMIFYLKCVRVSIARFVA